MSIQRRVKYNVHKKGCEMVRMPREDKCLQRVMDKNVNKKLQQK